MSNHQDRVNGDRLRPLLRAFRQALLMIVDAIEEYLDTEPRTAKLREELQRVRHLLGQR